MKNHLLEKLLCLFILLFAGLIEGYAQTPMYTNGTPPLTGGSTAPTSYSANLRTQILFPAGVCGPTVPNGKWITKIYLFAATNSVASVTYSSFKISIGQRNITSFPPVASGMWESSLTQAFSAAPYTMSPSAYSGNWVPYTLQTPFFYNPSLPLIVEFDFPSVAPATTWSTVTKSPVPAGSYYQYGTPNSSAIPTYSGASAHYVGFDLVSGGSNNASISKLTSPVSFCAGTHDIQVKLANNGNNVINNVIIKWELDGIAQTQLFFNSPLDTVGGSAGPVDTTITLGNLLFASGVTHTIKAWTEYPNSVNDTMNTDDTINVTIRPSLSGTFTIGGTSPDYASFTAAVNDLNNFGICGPVTFNITGGTYNERITINQISGMSATNAITFRGAGKSSTTLTYAGTSTADFATVLLNGADHVTFRDMTIEASNVTNGVGILLTSAADSNRFSNLKVQMNITSTATTTSGISISGTAVSTGAAGNGGNNNTFDSLEINGAYYGIRFYGTGSASMITNNMVSNCVLTNQYYYGINTYYHSGFRFDGNSISQLRNTTQYCILNYYGSNYNISKNKVQSIYYGIYNYYSNYYLYNAALTTEISNNMVVAGTYYGMYFTTNGGGKIKVLHNTITNTGVNATVYFVTTSGIDFRNNILISTNTGANSVIYIPTTATFDFLDYNNYYSAGTGFVTGTVYANLAAWKSAVPASNINSYSQAPLFVSATDLHLQPTTPVMKAPAVGVLNDIDGQLRNASTDIGADELGRGYNDAAALAPKNLIACGFQNVYARIKNDGRNVINNVTVNWQVNGVLQPAYSWFSPIDTLGGTGGSDTLLAIGSYFFTGTYDTIKVWTSMPNNVNDTTNANDTVTFIMKPGFAAGTYSVGSGGNYASLTSALAALNNGICGNVIFELQPNYTSTSETFPLTIPSGTSLSNTITIRPQSGATALSIAGNNGTAILDLNSSNYVIIDGRPGGSGINQLTVSNASTSGAVIRYINGASNNTLQYVTVTGNNATAISGNVFFSTGGNSNNVIDHCNINGNSASANCIYSSGTATPADNANNTITNCNIYDFFINVASGSANGVLLEAGNNSWNIGTTGNGNNFYQTAIRNTTSTPALSVAVGFRAVQINNATVNGCSIVGNRIGGSIPGITGSVFEIGDASATVAISSYIRAIDLVLAGSTVPTSIQGNTISDITVYTGSTGAGFAGIHVLSGWVNTGNLVGNTIGSATGTGSVKIFYKNTSTGVNVYGIRYTGTTGGLIANNTVGSITSNASTGGLQVLCIYGSGAAHVNPLIINNNLVGSLTTPHSVQAEAASAAPTNVMGLCLSGASATLITLSNNIISNLSVRSSLSNTTNGLKGIYITGASSVGTVVSGNIVSKLYSSATNLAADQSSAIIGINSTSSGAGSQVITNNTIYGLVSAAPSAGVSVSGVYYGSTTTNTTNSIDKNTIYGLTADVANALAFLNGISLGSATTAKMTLSNNMISLGFDSLGVSNTGGYTINGILKSGAVATILHNTIRIGGTGVASTALNTYSYRATVNASGDSLINNIFINTRNNATTGGTHYAVSLNNAVNLTTNYNLYYTTTAPIGLFNGTNQSTLADWKTATTQDANSVSTAVNFISNSNLHLNTGSIGNTILAGIPVSHINIDFDNQSRSVTYPYMGADENTAPVPVKLNSFTVVKLNNNAQLTWNTASEKNVSHFEVYISTDGKTFAPLAKVIATGNSSVSNEYNYTDVNALAKNSILYYQLKTVDRDGSFAWSKVVMISNEKTANNGFVVYPNPFSGDVKVSLPSTGTATVQVYNLQGSVIISKTITADNNAVTETESIKPGVYFIKVIQNGEQLIQKIVKQ